jgi:hypothetical protein
MVPKPSQSWQAAGFEAILISDLALMVLNLANEPKLNGPFVPVAYAPTSWPGAPWAAC